MAGAAFEIGRLTARLQASPLSGAWLHRASLAETLASCDLSRRSANRDALVSDLAGLPFSRHGDHQWAMAALQRLRNRNTTDQESADDVAVSDFLARIYRRSDQPDAGSRISIARQLGRITGSGTALPIVSQGLLARRRQRASITGGPALLDALETGARDALIDLLSLENRWRHWVSDIPARRSNSRAQAVFETVQTLGYGTPALISRTLPSGLSVRGASMILESLVEVGILRRATERKSWRIYTPTDLTPDSAPSTGQDRRLRIGGSASPPPPQPTVDLDALIADVDLALEKAMNATARLGIIGL
jgi:hypothetical protein